MNATLARIQDFKKAAKCSAWFYKLLEDMLLKHIDKCPLTMFMAGKLSCLTLYRLNKECGGEWPGIRGQPLESPAKQHARPRQGKARGCKVSRITIQLFRFIKILKENIAATGSTEFAGVELFEEEDY